MGENGASLLLFLRRVRPGDLDLFRFRRAGHVEVERQLAALPRTQQNCRHQRLGEAAPLVRHGHLNAGLLFDRPRLSQDHIEHSAIDGIVLAVDQDRSDGVALLPKPIDAPLALLMPGRVPGQIVVNDGIEVALQVDAFGEAIGRYKNAFLEFAEGFDPRPLAPRTGVTR